MIQYRSEHNVDIHDINVCIVEFSSLACVSACILVF